MNSFNSDEIIKLLDTLIGPVEATNYDEENVIRKRNLKNLISVIEWCFDVIAWSCHDRHDINSSIRDIGETAYSTMTEWKEWIEGVLKDYA